MDEALRRAERSGDSDRLWALRARTGADPFADGPVELPSAEPPGQLALSPGGRCLATLQADHLQVWDVAARAPRYSSRVSDDASVLARLDPTWVAWSDETGVHVWHPDLKAEERVLAAPADAGASALSSDGRWAGFACRDRVELQELGPTGHPTGERHVVLLEELDLDSHAYEAQLTRLTVVGSPQGPRFVAVGADTREEYCCSSEYHYHNRLRYGCLLFAGSPGAAWSIRESPDFLPETVEASLEAQGPARPLLTASGTVYLRGLLEGLDSSAGDDLSPDELAGRDGLETLAVHPAGELLLCNRKDELVLVRLGENGSPEGEIRQQYVDAFPGRAATFSPDGLHFAWSTEEGVSVTPLAFYDFDGFLPESLRPLAPQSDAV